jgi:hypothetical protein
MRSLAIALVLALPLTCFAGPWSRVIASTFVTVENQQYTTVCENGVCFTRKVRVVANARTVPTEVVKVRARRVVRQRLIKRRIFTRRRLFRRRCCV